MRGWRRSVFDGADGLTEGPFALVFAIDVEGGGAQILAFVGVGGRVSSRVCGIVVGDILPLAETVAGPLPLPGAELAVVAIGKGEFDLDPCADCRRVGPCRESDYVGDRFDGNDGADGLTQTSLEVPIAILVDD